MGGRPRRCRAAWRGPVAYRRDADWRSTAAQASARPTGLTILTRVLAAAASPGAVLLLAGEAGRPGNSTLLLEAGRTRRGILRVLYSHASNPPRIPGCARTESAAAHETCTWPRATDLDRDQPARGTVHP